MANAKATRAELNKMRAAGFVYIVVQCHENNGTQAGTVISKHRTHDAAAKKAGPSCYREIQRIDDALFYAL